MKRLLIAAALAAFPAVAQAGVGLTWQAGGTFTSPNGHYIPPFGLPTLDFHLQGGTVIQLNALDLVYGLPRKAVDVGGDFFVTTRRLKVNEDIGGVIQPGGRLEIATDTSFSAVAGSALFQLRMGAQTAKGMGFGIYVVPGLGAALGQDGEADLDVSGALQISTWMNKD